MKYRQRRLKRRSLTRGKFNFKVNKFNLIFSSSSDEEPVKKVPLKQVIKPTPPPPKSAENGAIKKKTVTPMEHDYRDERDQRTIFVKNLPFSASVDAVS